jgi:hypothetical protein
MQNIERYGLVALVFLVVTVGAVLIWNHSKDGGGIRGAKRELVADAPAAGALEDDSSGVPERVILHAEPSGRALRESTQAPGTLDIGATGAGALDTPSAGLPLAADPAAPSAASGTDASQAPVETAPRIEAAVVESAPLAGEATTAAAEAAPARPLAPAGRPRRGTSTRDWVRIGPSLAQPSGTQ